MESLTCTMEVIDPSPRLLYIHRTIELCANVHWEADVASTALQDCLEQMPTQRSHRHLCLRSSLHMDCTMESILGMGNTQSNLVFKAICLPVQQSQFQPKRLCNSSDVPSKVNFQTETREAVQRLSSKRSLIKPKHFQRHSSLIIRQGLYGR